MSTFVQYFQLIVGLVLCLASVFPGNSPEGVRYLNAALGALNIALFVHAVLK